MRENRIPGLPRIHLRGSVTHASRPAMLLTDLPDGAHANVLRLVPSAPEIGAEALRRLGELGFIAGEPVQVLRRGPGGREPIAVLIGDTLFALRLLEARCIEVNAA
jgi:ferrous iron transport protein A